MSIIERRPDLALAHSNLGLAIASLRDDERALDHFRRAIELEPAVPDARYNLASTLAKLGRADEAVEQYREAIRLRPNYAAAHFNLGNLLARGGRFEEAASEFREALVHDPDMHAACRNLGLALRQMDDWAGAVRAWSFGLARHPDDPSMMVELSQARLAAGDESLRDPKMALELAQRARSLAPRHAEASVTLAAALLANERWNEAIVAADHARQFGGDSMDCDLIAALAQDALEPHGVAMSHLQRVVNGTAVKEPMEPVRGWLLERARQRRVDR
jgi:Tfp pilus assembly protein PilF